MFVRRQSPRFDVALVDVRSTRAEFRLDAARALAGAEGDPATTDAREALRPLLDDPVARVRAVAIESLGYVGDDVDLPALARRTREPATELRQAAVIAIARIGTPEARIVLRGMLEAEAADVRYQAVEALGTLGDAPSTDRIVERVSDDDPFVREAALEALAALGASEHRALVATKLDDEPCVRRAAALALATFGDASCVSVLREILRGDGATQDVFEALADLRAEAAAPELRAIVRRRFVPATVALAAGVALASFGDPDGVAIVRKRLRSFFLTTRLEALARIARHRLLALAPDVAELAHSPRGLPVDLIAHTLSRLDSAAEARDGLAHLDRLGRRAAS